jgi:acetyl-CoA acetyltransferase
MAFRRHMEIYGTTTRQFAGVSVSVRYHACLNPDAVMRNPIIIEDHGSARFITAPLRLLDYCLINDGAVCLIITRKERSGDFKKPPVLISGFGAKATFSPSSIANFDMDFWYPAINAAGEQAYEMAGVTHNDLDALMCYDNFSPTVLFGLEGLGFCGRGMGAPVKVVFDTVTEDVTLPKFTLVQAQARSRDKAATIRSVTRKST